MISRVRIAAMLVGLAGCLLIPEQGCCGGQAHSDKLCETAVLKHPELDFMLNHVITRLWGHAHSDLPLPKLHVVHDAVPDARSYSDGAIYLTTGMIAQAHNEDQLAMILSHEIVHYTKSHANTVSNFTRSDTLLSSGAFKHQLRDLVNALEKEADREGLLMLRNAGYCPKFVLALMAATPEGSNRVSHLKRHLDQWEDDSSCQRQTDEDRGYPYHIAPALVANAMSAVRKGMWTQATDSLQRYLAVVPGDPQAHYLQGEVAYRALKQFDSAMYHYNNAIDLDRSFVPAYRSLGIIHFKAGNLQQARGFFETSLALAPYADENEYIRGYIKLCNE